MPTTVDKKARRKLIIASVLCVIFMIGEVIGKLVLYMFIFKCMITVSYQILGSLQCSVYI